MGRIIRFAVATAMRQDEICRVGWTDFDPAKRMLLIRNRKDPRRKHGNNQRIPLLDVSGYDASAIVLEQGELAEQRVGRIFPYNGRSVGTAFRRACRWLGIEDLHFHDLRHEATSRLFEAGFSIEQVALVTGHKDWKMLRRYTIYGRRLFTRQLCREGRHEGRVEPTGGERRVHYALTA